jgi:hypothetical protein
VYSSRNTKEHVTKVATTRYLARDVWSNVRALTCVGPVKLAGVIDVAQGLTAETSYWAVMSSYCASTPEATVSVSFSEDEDLKSYEGWQNEKEDGVACRAAGKLDKLPSSASQSLHDGTRKPTTGQKRAPVSRYHIHLAIYQPPFARVKLLGVRLWLSLLASIRPQRIYCYPFVFFGFEHI